MSVRRVEDRDGGDVVLRNEHEPGGDESTDLPMAKLVAYANRNIGRYLVIDCYKQTYEDDGRSISELRGELRGGDKPTIFRTMRNARSSSFAPHIDSEPIVLLVDLNLLPVVLPDHDIEKQPGFSEAAFAERQAELWALRAECLMKADKLFRILTTMARRCSLGHAYRSMPPMRMATSASKQWVA